MKRRDGEEGAWSIPSRAAAKKKNKNQENRTVPEPADELEVGQTPVAEQ